MGKYVPDAAMDALLDYLADCDTVVVCSAEPTNWTELTSTYALADVTVTAGDGGGDFAIANGDTDGRKLTLAQQDSVPIDANGDATHIGWGKSGDTTLRYVTICTTQALTSGGTVTIPAHKHTVRDSA